MRTKHPIPQITGTRSGFALTAALAFMGFLVLIVIALAILVSVNFATTEQKKVQTQARANAQTALMVALGELQNEMGPDMRISAQSAILDTDAGTEAIEGVAQSRWLASYEAWGNWLNAEYTTPHTGQTLSIQDTYVNGRRPMFRRWLLSLPEALRDDIDAPIDLSLWNETNSVELVGQGSLGDSAQGNPDQVTRAFLKPLGDGGNFAWWAGPENHKARINLAAQPRELTGDEWEVAQGNTAEVRVGALDGFDQLDDVLETSPELAEKLFSNRSLQLVPGSGITEDEVEGSFFDLTASSQGVLASVRTGHLKKDLSLLFEKDKGDLPSPYRFDAGDLREPSIRPMSPEISGEAVLGERHFAPWTRMRHFYRMYRQDSDAYAPEFASGGTDGSPGLNWSGPKPWTDSNVSTYGSAWDGQDTYYRFPVLTNITYILSLKTTPDTRRPGQFNLQYVASPVYIYWNPYNVEMRVPDMAMTTRTYLAQVHPLEGRLYLNDSLSPNRELILRFDDDYARMMSGDSQDIVFRPGEFRIFTPEPGNIVGGGLLDMLPGFDPLSYGGLQEGAGSYSPTQVPKFAFLFSSKYRSWKFNYQLGNTPGSFVSFRYWTPTGDYRPRAFIPFTHHFDWLNTSQTYTLMTPPNDPSPWVFDGELLPVAYFQMTLKGLHDHDYDTINWEEDWRCRNWVQAPPYYLGKGLYMSDDESIGHTQRIDSPYEFRFGSLVGSGKDVEDILQHIGNSAMISVDERVTAVPSLELPTAPIGSLAGFGTMRINPGWVDLATLNPEWQRSLVPRGGTNDVSGNSLYLGESKAWAYQSGVTGPGIGNSFLHPMIPRTGVYQFLDNSISMDMRDVQNISAGHTETDTKAYCDYWDHVLLLNDALWDDYFVSSLADQTRPGASAAVSLTENLSRLLNDQPLANSRYLYHPTDKSSAEIAAELQANDGYLKAAAHLMIDGMFNVNSTSVAAWQALFAGIRERLVVYRDQNGDLQPVEVPSDKSIALSRFNTATTNQECIDPEFGITRDDGMLAWSGVRFLDDAQLLKLAEECVKQVKRRGPFLNFSEFINRRLSEDDLGIMGALQAAIDYDDASPESGSINYDFKSSSDYMLEESDLGNHAFETPEAAEGSRFAGIPGYVIQSDLLKPIANTLAVRDDTFRIRAYGEVRDDDGNIAGNAWCEAIVQRIPEYIDPADDADESIREITTAGEFNDSGELSMANLQFGRQFKVVEFRWLDPSEV